MSLRRPKPPIKGRSAPEEEAEEEEISREKSETIAILGQGPTKL
jgi:hypothetical protein